jgi:hypothetical protein
VRKQKRAGIVACPFLFHRYHIDTIGGFLPGAMDDLLRAVLADLPDLPEPDAPTPTACAAVPVPA